MKRQNPYLSSGGLLLSTVFLAWLGFSFWHSGGTLFSPGRLSAQTKAGIMLDGFAAHADFEQDCSRCHQPLETTQDILCVKCHQTIQDQIQKRYATHGKIKDVKRCAACHRDHLGEDFNLTRSAFKHFDHQVVNFSLVRHQVDYDSAALDCDACHNSLAGFSIETENCASCHAREDLQFISEHSSNFGSACLACHDGHDQMSGFEHQTTAFPLAYRHAQISCRACHEKVVNASSIVDSPAHMMEMFREAPIECMACHKEPDLHSGEFSAACQKCHTAQSWRPANLDGIPFDHAQQTRFSLNLHKVDYNDQVMQCSACHLDDIRNFEITSCTACHSQSEAQAEFMQSHLDLFGGDCLDCHDGIDRMHGFNHQEHFPLEGKHADLDCKECHLDQSFAGTPQECLSCHEEPSIHAGFFGLNCENCHTSQAWAPAQLLIHTFPLNHGEQDGSDCNVCHADRYIEYTCYNCHEHQPEEILNTHVGAGISSDTLAACMDCHIDGEVQEKP